MAYLQNHQYSAHSRQRKKTAPLTRLFHPLCFLVNLRMVWWCSAYPIRYPRYPPSMFLLGSVANHGIYADVRNSDDVIAFLRPNATVGLFATYPQPYLTTFGGIVDQFTGTAVLMAAIFAMIDDKNGLAPPASNKIPIPPVFS